MKIQQLPMNLQSWNLHNLEPPQQKIGSWLGSCSETTDIGVVGRTKSGEEATVHMAKEDEEDADFADFATVPDK